ncbi:MAG: siphovirus Gp157 family protein [Alistipes sp.]|nr:siphovirus Gp157 family protein [Alistipes sp.]
MSNLSLYHITSEQLRINELLEESGGELTPEIEEALVINEGNFLVKAEGYIESIAKYKALAEAADVRIKEMQRIKKTAENIERRLKERLLWAMNAMERDRVEVGARKLSIRNTTSVNIIDEAHIPSYYIKVETKIDKDTIKRDLKNGIAVEGAELVTNQSIQIR